MSITLSTPRSQWVRALSMVDKADLMQQVNGLSANWVIKPKSQPQAGLGVLTLKESTLSESFFLGEFPLASVWVEVTTQAGQVAEGAANVMHDDVSYAEALALCDAILANELNGWQEITRLLSMGVAAIDHEENVRKALLASTRVDFSLLEDAGDTSSSDSTHAIPQSEEAPYVAN